MISEPSSRISSLSRPTAFSIAAARRELEQTSSAKPGCVGGRHLQRLALDKLRLYARLCDLPCGLAAGEACADHLNPAFFFFPSVS